MTRNEWPWSVQGMDHKVNPRCPPTRRHDGGCVLSSTTSLLNHLVDETPEERNRVVDAMRALSMAVVVVWH
jgi:hypothetical protein